jgi:hypothetical protein
MRKRLRLSLPLALALGLLLAAPDAQAINVRNVCGVMGVFLGLGDIIDLEEVAVPQRFHRRADQFILYLDLTENRISGEDIFLGSQQALLSNYTLVTPDGKPNGRAVYEAVWNTAPLEFGSRVTACAQLFRLTGRAASGLVCRPRRPIL